MAEVVFGEKDDGSLVELRLGEKITIELKENPTTGYRWIVSSIDEVFLVPEGDDFVLSDQKSLGAGGLHTFCFRAKETGSTELTLMNKRAWQTADQAIDTFKLAVRIVK